MARTAITPVQITRTGVSLPSETAADVPNGNSVANDGKVFLIVHNSNAGSTARTLTVSLARLVDGQAATARTYSIAAAATKLIGPFPVTNYGSSLLLDGSHAELLISPLYVGAT